MDGVTGVSAGGAGGAVVFMKPKADAGADGGALAGCCDKID